ncbi:hypothetical protein D5086_020020 [Populus alba]|uniref:Uncharacterized protein n=1 Tax=Populus alba TaxID=43335 RepID=A0ACC4BJI4_POPAL
MAATQALLCSNYYCSLVTAATKTQFNLKGPPSLSPHHKLQHIRAFNSKTQFSPAAPLFPSQNSNFLCHATRRKPPTVPNTNTVSSAEEGDDNARKVVQIILWVVEGVYILWLFLLPYAPGDPVWAISSETVNSLIGLSLNFFFILPFINSVGIRLIDAPVLHPMSEGLFNFVIGWTFMFAPLLFTDCKRDRYRWSLDVLWGFQMFLTNTFLIPYMAIRLNEADSDYTPSKRSQLGTIMTTGAPIVGPIGGAACLISVLWALFGRIDVKLNNELEMRFLYLAASIVEMINPEMFKSPAELESTIFHRCKLCAYTEKKVSWQHYQKISPKQLAAGITKSSKF